MLQATDEAGCICMQPCVAHLQLVAGSQHRWQAAVPSAAVPVGEGQRTATAANGILSSTLFSVTVDL